MVLNIAVHAYDLRDRWNKLSLAVQFLLAGGLVSFAVMLVIGFLVVRQIEDGVTRNYASATALYVDSVITPLLPDLSELEVLDEIDSRALDETLAQGALGERVVSFKLWGRDGRIIYAKDKSLVGKTFEPNDELEAAWTGDLVAQFDSVDELESAAEHATNQALFEIYNPVIQPGSSEIVAVSEFYEIADYFKSNLRAARLRSWIAVALVTSGFFALLSTVVFRGSRTIATQSHALQRRVDELSELLAQNRQLRLQVQRASQRTTAFNERYLRRIGADLHDGPAQLVAFAALRLDSDVLIRESTSGETREHELLSIKSSLDDAMREIRSICNGLVLPHIEAVELPEILRLAVAEHEQRTGGAVKLHFSGTPGALSPSEKICVYRFVQEALNNSYRHAEGAGQAVVQRVEGRNLIVEVSDRGTGFDPGDVRPEGLGLMGLRERVESLGGSFDILSSNSGTKVAMMFRTEEFEQA
jgi:signal transduction histidine kinase